MSRRATTGLIVTTSLLLAGCGSSIPDGAKQAEDVACPEGSDCYDEVTPVGPGGDMSLDAGDFYFEDVEGTPVTGSVELTIDNESNQYHNAEVIGAAEGSEIPEAEGGETGTATVELFPGEWTVICNVPGHQSQGMETTITVYATEDEAAEAAGEDGDGGDDEGGDAEDGGGDEGDDGGDGGGENGEGDADGDVEDQDPGDDDPTTTDAGGDDGDEGDADTDAGQDTTAG